MSDGVESGLVTGVMDGKVVGGDEVDDLVASTVVRVRAPKAVPAVEVATDDKGGVSMVMEEKLE